LFWELGLGNKSKKQGRESQDRNTHHYDIKKITKAFTIAAAVVLMVIPKVSLAEDIRLIVRGDDFGMTQGSLAAFEKGFNEGVLTCGSIIVPAPWFEGAADLAKRNPNWCLGVHLTLVGEWIGYPWRPVMSWKEVKSIVDDDGFFYGDPGKLLARKPKIEEIEAELRAQMNLALRKGIDVRYVDTHYLSPNEYPGFTEVMQNISRDFEIPISGWMGEKRLGGIYKVPVDQKEERAIEMLRNMNPGLWLWVNHIGIDSPEQHALVHTAPEDRFGFPGVGPHRAAELRVLLSQEVKSVIKEMGIKLVDYKYTRQYEGRKILGAWF
jgi:chitin disaccharide deacetylase